MDRAGDRYDVAILGGGLAGLTLALQLKKERPQTRVAVLEKRAAPAREAAFKVGESTSEIGARYYSHVIGLEDNLETRQQRKFGLRFFMTAEQNRDLSKRPELGALDWLPIHTYQLDRGRLENDLADLAVQAGVDLHRGARVESVEFGEGTHSVAVSGDVPSETLEARWLVDASGRASLLKRRLGLERDVPHTINSAWLRLDGGLDIEDWSDDEEWRARVSGRRRRFSTSHLCGEGYWVWLIQLASGPISLGICADPRFHPFERFDELDRWIEWANEHEPQLGAAVDARRDDVLDFLKVGDFAYGCERVYSPDRWALVGEAGAFVDPLYSPGSDFIAIGNSFVTDMVTRELEGEDVAQRVERLNALYFRIYENSLIEYLDHYGDFGAAQTMIPRVLWHGLRYWAGLPAMLFFQGRIADLDLWDELHEEAERYFGLLPVVERLLSDSASLAGANLLDGFLPAFPLQRDLLERHSDAELREVVRRNVALLESAAVLMFSNASRALADGPVADDQEIDPRAIALDHGKGSVAGGSSVGITPVQARRVIADALSPVPAEPS